jgi:hypothetical protein
LCFTLSKLFLIKNKIKKMSGILDSIFGKKKTPEGIVHINNIFKKLQKNGDKE